MKKLVVGLALAISTSGLACCGVAGGGKRVQFAGQTNIVIWDAATKTEHFIRDARFTSDAKDFGFIAPSPTQPELVAVSKKAFELLASLAPPPPPTADAAKSASAGIADAAVQVLQSKDVAGYHATTLRANDAHALATWLKQNGYQLTKGTEGWLKPYVAKNWVLTAFKVLNPSNQASTGPVRMSFHTERPFNPFLVPSENLRNRHPGLKLYFVARYPVEGKLTGTPWVTASWNAALPSEKRHELAQLLKLPEKSIPEHAEVSTFETSFRADSTDDVFFEEKASASALYLAPVGAVAALSILALVFRRSKKANTA